MRRALEYAASNGATIAQHAEESRLTEGAIATNEGPMAAKLGMKGWPRAAEEFYCGARHFASAVTQAHMSMFATLPLKGTVELLKWGARHPGPSISPRK